MHTVALAPSIRILGTVECELNGQPVTFRAPKVRATFALLALNCGEVVSVETLLRELWGDDLPKSSLTTLQTYVYQLRRLFASVCGGDGTQILQTSSPGYRLNLPADDTDLARFNELVSRAAFARVDGDLAEASRLLRDGEKFWRSTPLADVRHGEILARQIPLLEDALLDAVLERLDLDLELGEHARVIADARSYASVNPFHEKLHAMLMLALNGVGRRYEALEVFTRVQRVLREELGVCASASLEAAHRTVLDGTAGSPSTPSSRTTRESAPAGVAVPSQLPANMVEIIGRDRQRQLVVDLLLDRGERPGKAWERPGKAWIHGGIGSGKTALAINVAHVVREEFPDGQLFVDMRGSSDQPLTIGEVISGFLRSCGFDDAEIPQHPEHAVSLFRSWTTDRAVLVVVDDAPADLAALRVIEPAGIRCATLVTSRRPGEGVPLKYRVGLSGLGVDGAIELLGRQIGTCRVDEHLDEARMLVDYCGRLPVLIRAVGDWLTYNTHMSIGEMVVEVSDHRARRALWRELRPEVDAGMRAQTDVLTEEHVMILLTVGGIQSGMLSPEKLERMVARDRCLREALAQLLEIGLLTTHPARSRYQLPSLVSDYVLGGGLAPMDRPLVLTSR